MSFRARWAVPVAAVSVVGIVVAASAVAGAVASPSLPTRTVAQLLAEVQQGLSTPLGPLTATIQQTSNFGLPALPNAAQSSGPAGLVAGTQTVSIWYLNANHIRVAKPVQMGESDLRLNGHTLWLWDSKNQTATRVQLPAKAAQYKSGFPQSASNGNRGMSYGPSPQTAARQFLAAVGPSTTVTVQRNIYVAGRAAYQLSLAPKSNGSLVGQILIAIDGQRHIPLRVEIIPRGSSSPAFSLGYTALTFGRPSMSNFNFTPPPGATVKKENLPARLNGGLGLRGPLGPLGLRGLLGPLGPGWFGHGGFSLGPRHFFAPPVPVPGARQRLVPGMPKHLPAIPKQVLKRLRQQFINNLPKNMSKAQRAAAINAFDKHFAKGAPFVMPRAGTFKMPMNGLPGNGGGFFSGQPPAAFGTQLRANAPRVIGKDWLSVLATPPSPAVAAAIHQVLTGHAAISSNAGTWRSSPGNGQSQTQGFVIASNAPAPPISPILTALVKASTPVHGSWGSGRLLKTALVSVLFTSNGRILVGAVTPSVLYADAAMPVK